MEMSRLRTPIVSVVCGEGGSGGALGIGVADKVAMMEFAWYSVISPEACSAILFKGPEEAAQLAESLKLTSRDLMKLGVIDNIVSEPLGGAHRDPHTAAHNLEQYVAKTLRENAGEQGMRFFPLVFSLFMFVLAANLIGMFPYAFTVTSHLIITFSLAMVVFLTVTISATFIATLGWAAFTSATLGLLIGGVLAAPFGAAIAKKVNPDTLLTFVGALLTVVSLYGLYRAFA